MLMKKSTPTPGIWLIILLLLAIVVLAFILLR